MAYTSVFQTMRVEMGICIFIGIVIGLLAAKYGDG
jgi:hypothetical protein